MVGRAADRPRVRHVWSTCADDLIAFNIRGGVSLATFHRQPCAHHSARRPPGGAIPTRIKTSVVADSNTDASESVGPGLTRDPHSDIDTNIDEETVG